MLQALKKYFHYNPENPDFGISGLWFLFWILNVTGGKDYAIFILLTIYLAYTGNKFLILIAIMSVLTFIIYGSFFYQKFIVDSFAMPFACITFGRDMFFLIKYNRNAFANEKETNIEGVEFAFIVCLFLLMLFCITIFKFSSYW